MKHNYLMLKIFTRISHVINLNSKVMAKYSALGRAYQWKSLKPISSLIFCSDWTKLLATSMVVSLVADSLFIVTVVIIVITVAIFLDARDI